MLAENYFMANSKIKDNLKKLDIASSSQLEKHDIAFWWANKYKEIKANQYLSDEEKEAIINQINIARDELLEIEIEILKKNLNSNAYETKVNNEIQKDNAETLTIREYRKEFDSKKSIYQNKINFENYIRDFKSKTIISKSDLRLKRFEKLNGKEKQYIRTIDDLVKKGFTLFKDVPNSYIKPKKKKKDERPWWDRPMIPSPEDYKADLESFHSYYLVDSNDKVIELPRRYRKFIKPLNDPEAFWFTSIKFLIINEWLLGFTMLIAEISPIFLLRNISFDQYGLMRLSLVSAVIVYKIFLASKYPYYLWYSINKD